MLDHSKTYPIILMLIFLISSWLRPSRVGAKDAVVRAVLFYSPSCPHCHKVIQEVLPPLFEQYREQLEIFGVDTTSPGGSMLFEAAVRRFAIPPERQAVPMLILGEIILLGSAEIPEQFPGLIEQYLVQGGSGWPDIPGLQEALVNAQTAPTATPAPTAIPAPTATPAPTAIPAPTTIPAPTAIPAPAITPGKVSQADIPETATPQPEPTPIQEILSESSPTAAQSGLILPSDSKPGVGERLALDSVGNSLAIVILLGMLFSIVAVFKLPHPAAAMNRFYRLSIWIPILSLAGIAVAGYLSYVETAHVEAVCGPVGDCNTVQQSEYARLFGVFPIGVLGLAGYLAILLIWLISRFGNKQITSLAYIAILSMTIFGTLFSIYLAFLEPFVIGATCIWCLSSAMIMTVIMWLSIIPGKRALANL